MGEGNVCEPNRLWPICITSYGRLLADNRTKTDVRPGAVAHRAGLFDGTPILRIVDFYLEGFTRPLYLFGVAIREKAMLTTIILQHLNAAKLDFRSMVVFQNSAEMPAREISRLMSAANDMISSLDADEAFERKLHAVM